MTDNTKSCAFCGEKVLAVAVKCKHCGSELERSAPPTAASKPKKDTSLLTVAIVLILIIVALVAVVDDSPAVTQNSNVTRLPAISIPAEQQSFTQIVESFYQPYRDAGSNELQKSQQRLLRKEALQSSLSSLDFTGWVGAISSIGTTGDGNAHVNIELQSSGIEFMTTNNELSDGLSDIKTLIPIGSTTFNSLMNLKEDDVVKVSGRLVRDSSERDFISTIAITERGAMIDPSFLIRVESIERY